jgi:hypothetical protein
LLRTHDDVDDDDEDEDEQLSDEATQLTDLPFVGGGIGGGCCERGTLLLFSDGLFRLLTWAMWAM